MQVGGSSQRTNLSKIPQKLSQNSQECLQKSSKFKISISLYVSRRSIRSKPCLSLSSVPPSRDAHGEGLDVPHRAPLCRQVDEGVQVVEHGEADRRGGMPVKRRLPPMAFGNRLDCHLISDVLHRSFSVPALFGDSFKISRPSNLTQSPTDT